MSVLLPEFGEISRRQSVSQARVRVVGEHSMALRAEHEVVRAAGIVVNTQLPSQSPRLGGRKF